jgi:two-component system CheB/CheR fusion protein
MPKGGNIRIATSNVALDASTAAKLHLHARPGDYVVLTIVDNGLGMTEEVIGKAMEPFFTTKGPGVGTGLGLPSVADFSRKTGGFTSIKSAPEQGCAVSIYLPRAIETSTAGPLRQSESVLGRGQLVLVVEDNDAVREVTLKRLESLGYAAIGANTGQAAVERLRQESVQLVLSDVIMPGGMTGYDVARWVAANMPNVKVIICSGYSEEDRDTDGQDAIRNTVFLAKPYTRDQLAQALNNALAPLIQ